MTTVALVGGAATPTAFWRRVRSRLPDDVVTTVGRPGGAQTLEVEVARVCSALERARRRGGGDPVVLVGHSMGGFVVEAAARCHPDSVGALVLVDSSVPDADEQPGRATRAVLERARRVEAPVVERPAAAVVDWLAYEDLARELVDLRTRTAMPSLPVELLTVLPPVGSAARRWRREHERLVDALESGGGTVERREGPGLHSLMLDRPDVVVAAIHRAAERAG